MKKAIMIILFVVSIFSLTSCKQENNNSGSFYSIKEAYEQKLLSRIDLESISNHHDSSFNLSFVPITLDENIEMEIKEDYLLGLKSRTNLEGTLLYPEATIDDVSILGYYGEYNNCYAVMMTDVYTEYTLALRNIKVGGVEFNYRDGNSILVWKGIKIV